MLGVIAVLLTFASGASDVASFTRLGNVFTSVMTGNLAVFGLSLARGSMSLALHTLLAVCGYVVGVTVGTRIAWLRAGRAEAGPRRDAEPGAGAEWDAGKQAPPHLTVEFVVELLLYAGVVIGWEAAGSRPSGAAQYALLAMAACAMGIQSAAVNQMGLGNLSTTYMTGTLTGLVSDLVRRDGKPVGWRRQAALLGLLGGASLAGVCVANAAAVTPLLPLLAAGAATALYSGRRPPRLRLRPVRKPRRWLKLQGHPWLKQRY